MEDAEAQECPVCYEGLADTARTLSCSHTFCHDCLVRTLVSISRDAVITRDSIVCPVCRHLTFITKRTDLARDEKSRRILEVPLSGPPQGPSGPATSPSPLAGGLSRLSHYVRWVSSRLSRQRLVRPSNPPSQVFIISDLGRPMKEGDVSDLPAATVIPPARRAGRRRLCTTARCVLVLLLTFSLVALMTVTLPWILLA